MPPDDLERDGRSPIDREIDYHIERTTEEFIARGENPVEARRRALNRFGDVQYYRDQLTTMRRRGGRMVSLQSLLERLADDLRFGYRYALRHRALTLGVAVTVALGVGANATMYSVIDRILLTVPPHIEDASNVKRVFVEREFLGVRRINSTMTYPDVMDWTHAESFSSVAAFTAEQMTLGAGVSAQRIPAVYVTHNFFPLLGTPPHRGRLFTPEDDVRGAQPVAIIGYDFWQREFGGRKDVLGTMLDVGHARYRVVGIAPRGFTGVDLDRVDVWLPLFTHIFVDYWADSRGNYFLHTVARLAPGVEKQAAEAEATLLHRRGRDQDPHYDRNVTARVEPLLLARGPRASDESVVAKWLAGVSIFVLIIACSNVANLLLAQGARQRREMAVRLALGVPRARLVRQLLLGSLVFALWGAVGALAVAQWGGILVGRVLLPDVDWSAGVTSPRILAFTGIVALLASVMAALIPAVKTTDANLVHGLKHGARGASAQRSKLRSSLLVAQAALSVVLLVGSGLFVKSLHRVESVNLGFDPTNVYVVRLELPQITPRVEAYMRALDRLHQIPFVEAASVTNTVPFQNSIALDIGASGRDSMPVTPSGGPYVLTVTPDYFAVMDLTVIRGRQLNGSDVPGTPWVTVVNETMARLVWPRVDAIGQCLFLYERHLYPNLETPPCTEVVGIVEDSHRQNVIEEEQMLYYLAAAQYAMPPQGLMVRSPVAGDQIIAELRAAVFDAVPETRFVNVQPMTSLVDPDFRSWRLGASVFTAFGILALLVAAVGLYSVLAFDVAQRRAEIGVRSALGATSQRLVRWVMQEAVELVIVGIAVGALIAMIAGRAMESLLYQTSAWDPGTYIGVGTMLLGVALLASALPAVRATRVDPVNALRADE